MSLAEHDRIEQQQAASLDFSRSLRQRYVDRQVTVPALRHGVDQGNPQVQPTESVQEALIALREAQDISDRTLIAVRQDRLNSLIDQARLNSLIDQARRAPEPRSDFGAGPRPGVVGTPADQDMNRLMRAHAWGVEPSQVPG